MTMHTPDDVARTLEGIAAAQHKSVEQVAIESLRSLFDLTNSPQIVLQSLRQLPHPSAQAVDDLDAAIVAGKLPMVGQGVFDKWQPG